MTYCCVPLCNTDRKSSDGISFHEFPVNLHTRAKWLEYIARNGENNSDPWMPSDRSAVCSKHFLPDDYKQNLKTKRLKPSAIPSVFPDYLGTKKISMTQPRETSMECKPAAKKSIPTTVSDSCNDCPLPDSSKQSGSKNIFSKDVSTSTKLTMDDISIRLRKYRNIKQNHKYLVKKMTSMKSASLKQINKSLKQNLSKYKIDQLEKACDSYDKKAMFLLEQLTAFTSKRKRWSEKTMRYCVLWHSKLPTSYRFIRSLNILTLPSRSALRRFSESVSVGIDSTL